MQVTKRNGSKENFDLDKIHKVLTWATEGIDNVSVSDIEMNAKLKLYDGMPTKEIHQLLVKSAGELISLESPNYQYVASRLAIYSLRKEVWGSDKPPRLYEYINIMIDAGLYDSDILNHYSKTDILKLDKVINHDNDYFYTLSGIQQMQDKYLVKNRLTGQIFETPQFAYMLIAMSVFKNYKHVSKAERTEFVKKTYLYLSHFKINLATPVLAGIRTNNKQFSSCILIDVDDSLNSIFSSNTAIGQYIAQRAGIGINAGRIRPIGASVRNGDVVHTGIIPFLKMFQSTVSSCSQGGIRKGSATVNIPFWHPEVMSAVVLKNNAGTDENRVRHLDYVFQFSKIFYERFMKKEDISLFCPHENKDLRDAFGTPEFDRIYLEKESNPSVKRTTINAVALMELFCRERLETGRIYLMNIDHCNTHSAFLDTVRMTNLCVEITHPTKPLNHIDDKDAEIGVCVLSAVNMLNTSISELQDVTEIIVRILEYVIDEQDYPVKAAENFARNRRSLAVGITNLAGYLAANNTRYSDDDAVALVSQYVEAMQFYLLSASSKLAVEFGPCAKYDRTTYSQGLLPIDTYKKSVDEIYNETFMPWEELRATIKETGLRNSTVTAQMPVESSSVVQNSTNSIDPVRDLLSYKKAKNGVLKQVVPNIATNGEYYETAFSMRSMKPLIHINAVIQKWMDMSISTNLYYNYSHYEDKNIPLSVMVKDILYAYKLGIKTLYYNNTPDSDSESGCAGGACTL